MGSMPIPVRLFHITAIDNLAAIFDQGALLCKARSQAVGIDYKNIAHAGAQGVRASKAVIDPPGGFIHDYVPFYFAPRSPMLMAINGGKVQGCTYAQSDIVHFELLVRTVVEAKREFVFYDRNATKEYSLAFTDPYQLQDVIAWELLTEEPTLDGFCKYFHDRHEPEKYIDRMERRQAEFLVKDHAPLNWMTRIGVISQEKADIVRNIMARNKVDLPVVVMPDWYF